jgi:outer membrane receptor protein involved in Fe transport
MDSTGAVRIFYDPERSQKVDSGYLEISAPLISARHAKPGLRELEVQASMRRDEYTTRSVSALSRFEVDSRDSPLPDVTRGTNDITSKGDTIGLRYSPISDLNLRVSYGTGFLPASISQIVGDQIVTTTFVADPKRDNVPGELGPLTLTFNGNSELKPERSKSWSAGAIFTPHMIPDLRLSVDYTNIEKTDEISSLQFQELLNFEDSFPGRVIRGPNLPDDPLGWAGPITAFDGSLVNIARAVIEAVDVQTDYVVETEAFGTFNMFALATFQQKLERQVLSTSLPVDTVGLRSGPLKLRGNGGFTWAKGPLTLGWNAQYYDSYFMNESHSVDQNQGSAKIPSQTYHDIFVRYRSDRRAGVVPEILADTELMIGIRNVFNKSPPILATGGTDGYSRYGDPRLRFYSFSVRRNF